MSNIKKNFQDLLVWQKSVDLSAEIYKITESYPKNEIFGLTNQIRRASVSIASNIAEGAARYSKPEFKHFLSISIGSVAELKTQLIISNKVGFLNKKDLDSMFLKIDEISKMLLGLRNKI